MHAPAQQTPALTLAAAAGTTTSHTATPGHTLLEPRPRLGGTNYSHFEWIVLQNGTAVLKRVKKAISQALRACCM